MPGCKSFPERVPAPGRAQAGYDELGIAAHQGASEGRASSQQTGVLKEAASIDLRCTRIVISWHVLALSYRLVRWDLSFKTRARKRD